MSTPIVGALRRALAIAALAVIPLGFSTRPPAAGVIQGRVTDTTNSPLTNVMVAVEGTSISTLTNDSGQYRLSGVSAGRVKVRAAYIGYQVAITETLVEDGKTVTLDFRLAASPASLDSITITAARQPLVPRDEVTTRQRLEGEYLSIRGGRQNPAPSSMPVGANAIQEAIVTTGAASADMSKAQSGVVGVDIQRYQAPVDREQYARIYDNAFLSAQANPLSTFSIDVDAASYSNIRRFLTAGQLPPADAVRIEEMINYFHYEYAEPDTDHPFSVTTEMAEAPWNARHQLVLIGLQGRHIRQQNLPPSNLVFLLDVSGSMTSADKLPLVKSAFRLLVQQLRPDDRVAIVVYAGAAGLVLPSTPGSARDSILQAIDGLEAGGSTAGGAGIQLAYRVARENFIPGGNNRVILATDGDFNVGVSSDAELIRMIEEKRTEGTFLTVLGFGTGNLQDAKMEQLADKGNGNYAYVDNINEARKVFVHELGATLFTIAKDVKLQIEFNPARVAAYRLIGYENRVLRSEDFNDDTKDAGELGAGHSVTALYEIVLAGQELDVTVRSVDSLKYQTQATPTGMASSELMTVKLRYKRPNEDTSQLLSQALDQGGVHAGPNLGWASAVAGFGMVLRGSEHRGTADAGQVLRLARQWMGDDEQGYRAEFVSLVEKYRDLRTTALRE